MAAEPRVPHPSPRIKTSGGENLILPKQKENQSEADRTARAVRGAYGCRAGQGPDQSTPGPLGGVTTTTACMVNTKGWQLVSTVSWDNAQVPLFPGGNPEVVTYAVCRASYRTEQTCSGVHTRHTRASSSSVLLAYSTAGVSWQHLYIHSRVPISTSISKKLRQRNYHSLMCHVLNLFNKS